MVHTTLYISEPWVFTKGKQAFGRSLTHFGILRISGKLENIIFVVIFISVGLYMTKIP